MRCFFPGLLESIYTDWVYKLSRFCNYKILRTDYYITISNLIKLSNIEFDKENKEREKNK